MKTAFLHYSAPPVTGGVETVLAAHAQAFLEAGYPVTVIAGQAGERDLPAGAGVVVIPEMDIQHPEIVEISEALEHGQMPPTFTAMRDHLSAALRPVLQAFDAVIIHNVLTAHFNLPLTAALFQLLDKHAVRRCIAWCHDAAWAGSGSQPVGRSGYPWDLLRTYLADVRYVAVSERGQQALAERYNQPKEKIEVIYNGFDPCVWYGLTPEGWDLIHRLDLLSGDLIMLMPARVIQSRNIELAARVLAALKERGCCPRLVITSLPGPRGEDSMMNDKDLFQLRDALDLQRELFFFCEPGGDPGIPFAISQQVAADLLRICDILFMPSHRAGLGQPVLEAGLFGTPVLLSDQANAAKEVDGRRVYLFDLLAAPEKIAELLLERATRSQSYRFRCQIRQNLTWETLFRKKIEPLLRNLPG